MMELKFKFRLTDFQVYAESGIKVWNITQTFPEQLALNGA